MPIRFRCAYCNQLMGISSRKAGTVVKCPKCAGEIIVPVPEGEAPAEQAPEPSAPEVASSGSFEEKDFEQYFNEASNGGAVVTPPAPIETTTIEPTAAADSPPPLPQRRGLFLSMPMLFVTLAVIVALLIAMFVGGLLIGRHSTRHPPSPHPQPIESKEAPAIHPPGEGSE